MTRSKNRDRSEAEFLAAYDPTQFERVSVAVDVVLLSVEDGLLRTWLLRRTEHPDKGRWALPGTFVRPDESLDQTAARVLEAKVQVPRFFLEQLYTFGTPRRDPRTRVMSVAYYALVEASRLRTAVADRPDCVVASVEVPWEGETGGAVDVVGENGEPLNLAFDHGEMLGMAVKRIRGKLDYSPIGFQMLPSRFTLLALQRVHETVLGRPLNKDSFRRRMLASGQLEATGESERDVEHRPAELYQFTKRSAV